MNSVIGIINSNLETLTDYVLDVDSECLEEPMPHPFNQHIMNTAYLQRGQKLVFVKLRCICCSENRFQMKYSSNKYRKIVFTASLSDWHK